MTNYTKQDYERDLIIVLGDAPHGWTHSSKSTYFKLCDDGAHYITSVGWKLVDLGHMVNLRSKLCIENQVALYEANQKLIAAINESIKDRYEQYDHTYHVYCNFCDGNLPNQKVCMTMTVY